MVLIGAAVLAMVGAVPAVGDVVRWHRDNRRAHRGARPGQQEVLIVPAPLGHDRHRAPPSTFLGYFLVLYLRAYMAMLGQALRIMPSFPLPILYGVWQRLGLPVVALPDIVHAQVNVPKVQVDVAEVQAGLPEAQADVLEVQDDLPEVQADDAPFFATSSPTSTTAEETRVLRHILKFMKKLQDVLRRGGSQMSTKDKARTVSALVAKNKATLRTCRVPFAKSNVLLAPVTDLATLLRPRTGAAKISEGREVHLMNIIFGRADVLENAIAQALWIGTWPTVPDEFGAIAKPPSSKENKLSTRKASSSSSAVHCRHRRRASAVINPRLSHLGGSGAVVVA